jgi:hypothetical protein
MEKPVETRSHADREEHVQKIIGKYIDLVESEHGVWGLDYIIEIVGQRRFAAIQELQDTREKVHRD